MEFWVGLSVGMHLGKIIADYLQKFVDAYGLLDATTLERMNELATVGSEISSVVDGELGGDWATSFGATVSPINETLT